MHTTFHLFPGMKKAPAVRQTHRPRGHRALEQRQQVKLTERQEDREIRREDTEGFHPLAVFIEADELQSFIWQPPGFAACLAGLWQANHIFADATAIQKHSHLSRESIKRPVQS